jgi:addiction module RelB/DinJ family antitoxin
MARVIRSTMLQMRVTPAIRLALENVLERLGLDITEATEMFYRRMIIDQRIPFDVVAIDPATYTRLLLAWEKASKKARTGRSKRSQKGTRSGTHSKRQ